MKKYQNTILSEKIDDLKLNLQYDLQLFHFFNFTKNNNMIYKSFPLSKKYDWFIFFLHTSFLNYIFN